MSEYKEIYTNIESESESEDEEWNLEVYSSDEEYEIPKKKRKISKSENLLRNKMSKNSKNRKTIAPKKSGGTLASKNSLNKIAPHRIERRRRRNCPNKTSAISG